MAEQNLMGGTKKRSAEQKLVSTVSHWVTGTPSASAKRSAEQKLVSGTKHRTKIGGQKKKVSGTKIGGHFWPLGDRDPKCKCKKVSGTKIGERNENGRTKIGGWNKKRSAEQKLVGAVGHWVTGTPSASAKRSAEQKLVSRTKTAEQKLVGRKKKGQQNKNWWALLAIG